jgi:hypothetical protein
MATPQVQNDPIYGLAHLYISGMNISAASTTVLAIAPGQCRDSNDVIDMPIGFPNLQGNVIPAIQVQNYYSPLFINSAVNGANGLDAGTLAASTNYAIWVIGDSRGYKNVAGLLSLTSNAAPLLPLGYDSLRLIGMVTTDGSAHFLNSNILNAVNLKAFYLQPEASVLAAGNATTFTAIDLSTPIPTTTDKNVIAYLDVLFTPAAIGDYVQFRPTGSTATAGLNTIFGVAAGTPQRQFLTVFCGVGSSKPEIDYLVSSSSDAVTVLVTGYSFTTT